MTDTATDKLLLSVADVCRALNISRSQFFSLRSAGRIPLSTVRLSRKLLFRADELRDWVSAGCPAHDKWIAIRGANL